VFVSKLATTPSKITHHSLPEIETESIFVIPHLVVENIRRTLLCIHLPEISIHVYSNNYTCIPEIEVEVIFVIAHFVEEKRASHFVHHTNQAQETHDAAHCNNFAHEIVTLGGHHPNERAVDAYTMQKSSTSRTDANMLKRKG
jgi:hypothetical protein